MYSCPTIFKEYFIKALHSPSRDMGCTEVIHDKHSTTGVSLYFTSTGMYFMIGVYGDMCTCTVSPISRGCLYTHTMKHGT